MRKPAYQPFDAPFRNTELNLQRASVEADQRLMEFSLKPLRDSLNYLGSNSQLHSDPLCQRLNQSAEKLNQEVQDWVNHISRNSHLEGVEAEAMRHQLDQKVYELKRIHNQMTNRANKLLGSEPQDPGPRLSPLNSMRSRLDRTGIGPGDKSQIKGASYIPGVQAQNFRSGSVLGGTRPSAGYGRSSVGWK